MKYESLPVEPRCSVNDALNFALLFHYVIFCGFLASVLLLPARSLWTLITHRYSSHLLSLSSTSTFSIKLISSCRSPIDLNLYVACTQGASSELIPVLYTLLLESFQAVASGPIGDLA